jgi:ankyrin repeat protein
MYVNSISTEDTCKHQNVEVSIRNDGRITYVALRAIDVGEELIVSYGHDYFSGANYTRFECGSMSSIAIAAARGNAGRVRDMIADRRREGKNVGSLVNSRAHGWTPLHEASNRGHAEAITALVEGGAAVDQVTQSDGKTPLIIASELGHKEAVNVLLAAGASINSAREFGGTALMCACQHGFLDVAELLLDRGADVGQEMQGGVTALMYACQNGHRGVAELLLDRDANVGQLMQDGTTALMYACQNGHRDVAELLLDRDADVGQTRPDGGTALMAARYAGHDDMAELLLSRGADRNEDVGPGTHLSPPRVSAEAPHRAELGSRRLAVRTST